MILKVKDATSAVANVDDYTGSARLLAATTLRKIFQYFLNDILLFKDTQENISIFRLYMLGHFHKFSCIQP